MKIIGIKQLEFTGKDGTKVKGYTVFYSEPIEKDGKGFAAEKFFISEKKRKDLETDFEVGDEITLLYNKYGKVAQIVIEDVLVLDD